MGLMVVTTCKILTQSNAQRMSTSVQRDGMTWALDSIVTILLTKNADTEIQPTQRKVVGKQAVVVNDVLVISNINHVTQPLRLDPRNTVCATMMPPNLLTAP